MIDYISKYQNNYVASYLFRQNLPAMMEKGININKLICDETWEDGEIKYHQAHIFKITVDYDEWPANHTNDSYEIRPYNDSFFTLFSKYSDVFPE